jgi:hypothetical protein
MDLNEAYADELQEGQDFTEHQTGTNNSFKPWHARISVEGYMFVLVVGSLAVLWALGGSFRKVLS